MKISKQIETLVAFIDYLKYYAKNSKLITVKNGVLYTVETQELIEFKLYDVIKEIKTKQNLIKKINDMYYVGINRTGWRNWYTTHLDDLIVKIKWEKIEAGEIMKNKELWYWFSTLVKEILRLWTFDDAMLFIEKYKDIIYCKKYIELKEYKLTKHHYSKWFKLISTYFDYDEETVYRTNDFFKLFNKPKWFDKIAGDVREMWRKKNYKDDFGDINKNNIIDRDYKREFKNELSDI